MSRPNCRSNKFPILQKFGLFNPFTTILIFTILNYDCTCSNHLFHNMLCFQQSLKIYPWRDSNSHFRFRRPLLYPLSYKGLEAQERIELSISVLQTPAYPFGINAQSNNSSLNLSTSLFTSFKCSQSFLNSLFSFDPLFCHSHPTKTIAKIIIPVINNGLSDTNAPF